MSRQQAKDSRNSIDVIYDDMEQGSPVGMIVAFGGNVAPDGWHLCDGSAHGSAALQAAIGSANTPDLRGKFVLAASASHPKGQSGGEETHTLTAAEMPSHGHGVTDPGHSHGLYMIGSAGGGDFAPNYAAGNLQAAFAATVSSPTGVTVQSSGGGGAHNNMPPFYALTYIIRKA